jgi:hypothetical protein
MIEMQLFHLLSSCDLEADSTRLLNLLLDRDMPYQRCIHKMTFHASFRAPDRLDHPASAMYECHQNGSVTARAVIDLVDAMDYRVSRFVNNSVECFNDVSIILSQGESIDLLARAAESKHIAAHRAILQ